MMSKVTGLSIAFFVLATVVSASTLVTYNIMKSEDWSRSQQRLTLLKEPITTH